MSNVRQNVTILGSKELKELCAQLPARVNKRGARRAVVAASKPVVKDAKKNAARETGLLKKAIGRKVKTYKNGAASAIVGARRQVQAVVKTRRGTRKAVPANYGHLVEGGTKPHMETMANGQQIHHPGSDAQPWLHPAYENNRERSAILAKWELEKATIEEARKMGYHG